MDLQQIAADAGISIDEVRERWLSLRVAIWKSDLRRFAKEAVHIRTKSGDLEPLAFNEAQLILHNAAEEQLADEQWIRLAGLKGRRQGFCVDPSTRVLTVNLQWVSIDNLPVGSEIIAVDERGEGKAGRGFKHRKMRTGRVEAKWDTYQEAYRLTFNDGSSVVCSAKHRWLVRSNQCTLVWAALDKENSDSYLKSGNKHQLKIGDVIRGVTDTPWNESTFDDAWFGGILDGEGSFHDRPPDAISMSVVQRENEVWWKMLKYTHDMGYEPKLSIDGRKGEPDSKGKQGSNPINVIELNKMKHIFRCLGLCRPVRFNTRWWEGRKLPTDCERKIISIESLGERRLIDIQTTTKTFIAEGLISHNSTYVATRGYWRSTLWDRQNIYILSHEMAASNKLFEMVDLMQQKHPFPPQVGTDNAKELEFVKRGSSYQVATAGQKAGGRGGAISFFHGSEAAWWTNAPDHFASSVQAVDEVRGVWGVLWREPARPLLFERGKGEIYGWVKPPSEIWLETTSAGPTGEFYKRYMDAMKGIGRYRAVFVPWTVQAEYQEAGDFIPHAEAEEEGDLSEIEYQELYGLTDAQMLWRRSKIHELGSVGKFRQEYPIDITEAFAAADTDAYIKPALVLRARKRKMEEPDAPLIIGVDPAGSGGDRFAVSFRRGDKILNVIHRQKLEHDEAVAWLSTIIDEYQPNRMCIDRGSMGQNIVSALRNLNKRYADIVKGIDFGGTSRMKQATPKRAGPWNRRAEMYQDFKDWLVEGGAIPDDDDLASDISGPKQKWRANNDWLLESKTDMKARGLRSSDLSDACALTFATKEWFDSWKSPNKPKGWGAGIDQNEQFAELRKIDRTGLDNDRDWDYGGADSWMG